MTRMRTLAAAALAVLAFGVALAPTHAATRAACAATPVHYAKDTSAAGGLQRIPWLAAGQFHAHLFFYGGTPWTRERLGNAHIFTTVKTRNVSPKVLWTPARAGSAPTLRISGRRLDAPGRFSYLATRVPGDQFPSYVEVPQAGCWRVSVASGTLRGAVTFVAVDSF
jgi:hypothetical protein